MYVSIKVNIKLNRITKLFVDNPNLILNEARIPMPNPNDFFTKVPKLRPTMNIGCLFDIPTGTYYRGKHGESILNAGYSHVIGVCGRANTYKSTVSHFFTLSVLNRYFAELALIYDTENSLTPARIERLSSNFDNLSLRDLDEEGVVHITDTSMSGNKWFEALKGFLADKVSSKKGLTVTTPFLNSKGESIKIVKPTLAEVDSLSEFRVDAVDTMAEKNEIGDSGRNMEAMKGSAAKSQMIGDLGDITSRNGLYIIMTAHLDDEIQLDPYAPPQKRLGFMKQKTIFKRVPKNFSFLTNVLYQCSGATVRANKADKTPLWPRHKDDRQVGDTDLQQVTVQALRSKTGASGLPFNIIVSQSDGMLVGLTEYNYCKERKYGMGGNDQNFFMELRPDVTLNRTTIRGKIDNDVLLQRALEITSEMCQISVLWKNLEPGLMCTPKELFADLKAKGYDWDVLLNTRGYWVFDEQKHPLNFLSTMDLLNMRAGTYHPYWLKKK